MEKGDLKQSLESILTKAATEAFKSTIGVEVKENMSVSEITNIMAKRFGEKFSEYSAEPLSDAIEKFVKSSEFEIALSNSGGAVNGTLKIK